MALRLDARRPDFADRFAAFLAHRRDEEADVSAAVAAILDDVRARGDAALLDYTARFDRLKVDSVAALAVTRDEVAAATARCDAAAYAALRVAAERIEAFHRRFIPFEPAARHQQTITVLRRQVAASRVEQP